MKNQFERWFRENPILCVLYIIMLLIHIAIIIASLTI